GCAGHPVDAIPPAGGGDAPPPGPGAPRGLSRPPAPAAAPAGSAAPVADTAWAPMAPADCAGRTRDATQAIADPAADVDLDGAGPLAPAETESADQVVDPSATDSLFDEAADPSDAPVSTADLN